MNEETVAKMAEAENCPSPLPTPNCQQHPDLVYECCWDSCDWQFEDMQDCIEHAVTEGCGHVHMYFAAVPPHGQFSTICAINIHYIFLINKI